MKTKTNMQEELQKILETINGLIYLTEEKMGEWDGTESGALEDQAGLYQDVQDRLEESKKYLLEAIVLLQK